MLERLKQTGTKKIYEAYDMDKHLPVLAGVIIKRRSAVSVNLEKMVLEA